MTRLHDMGGRFGDGPVRPEGANAPVFAAEWHARALAVTLACGALGQWNIDTSRHAREKLAPLDYTRFSYYEIWLAALADLLVQKGVLSEDDLAGQGGDGPHPLADRKLSADAVAAMLAKGGPATRTGGPEPVFSEGQSVRTRHPGGSRLVDGGHTRLPAYATGATGRILRLQGTHVLPDSAAHGLGEAPEPLYAVVFPAGELWSHPEDPADEVVLDLWQSYLEAV
ncbi:MULTISPECIES: nitrile hydratase subunit beta [Rhodobacterales]|uniref:nitrile hydratase n=1 Tax=Phaeobacter gallaeciensis TaxID=60890 RepID=A0AAW6KWH8_9RHOB|nr:nitrile hydratase subunit beta [Phaeobacter gallaeciensis]MDF1770873.1 nitrile hydratase subunit beta [Pseudophaeobacter sp. bin_em_oilr2.035]MEE2633960.1 nitrile hydratase subunit beta [Pseudomonadota bacterium]MDE4061663.1 nitrile hydratase subunit beta [Phaeobacter gallaeciensis]MDE4099157.1 nitrile hydratase subunit beta [Phaeobacter gallaeciensis]MDE4107977.1 nitrile hydratase subunit beta [Phaeobacter gallaeciensis]